MSAYTCERHVFTPDDTAEHAGDCLGSRCPECSCCIHCGQQGDCPCTRVDCGCFAYRDDGPSQALERTPTERHIDTLISERDRARAIAATLEQQNALLMAALNVALHSVAGPIDPEALDGCHVALGIATGADDA